MLGAQSCFIKALQNSKISYVSPFFYSSLIFVIIYDFFILKFEDGNSTFL